MRLVCISDTHQQHQSIIPPLGDVLIVAGDICSSGYDISEIQRCSLWLENYYDQYKKIIVIAGNHDRLFEQWPSLARETLTGGMKEKLIYLEGQEVTIDGIKFYGDPHQPEFCGWAFNVPRGKQLREVWKRIPDDTDVLITHGPPFGIGDMIDTVRDGGDILTPQTRKRKNVVGDYDLLNRVSQLRLTMHIFGHIHDARGVYRSEHIPQTLFVNASICNESYQPVNKSIVIDINKSPQMLLTNLIED